MKKSFNLSLSLCFALLLFACTKTDPVNEGGGGGGGGGTDPRDKPILEWIENNLETYYLWNGNVRQKNPSYSLDYESFFESLLSTNREDGKTLANGSHYFYSYIEKEEGGATRAAADVTDATELSFGWGLTLMTAFLTDTQGYNRIYAAVSYVVEGSPADMAGIKRGDYILAVNGTEFLWDNDIYVDLFYRLYPKSISGSTPTSLEITVCDLVKTGEEQGLPVASRENIRPVSIAPEIVENNPVFYSDVIPTNRGKAGYLVYNAFEHGGEQTHPYDDDLKEVFREFKSAGVNDLVLDLRYNGGGYVSSCQLLSSMIVGADKLGTPFQKMVYNASFPTKTLNYLRESEMNDKDFGGGSGEGTNLDLPRLYVITTAATASSSEALMHCLAGSGVEVIRIGTRTEGKNVGMYLIDSNNSPGTDFEGDRYEMWPITFYIKDANGNGYANSGFLPDYEFDEDVDDLDWKELGDRSENLLAIALAHINGEDVTRTARYSTRGTSPNRSLQKIRDAKSSMMYRVNAMKDTGFE